MAAITDRINAYIYAQNFSWILYTHKNWDTVEANWRLLSEHGVKNAYDQGSLVDMAAQWTAMKFYCESNIMWDLSNNYDDLAYEFIDHYYGICAEDVREMYDLMTTYVEYIHSKAGYTGNVYFKLNEQKYWSFSYVEGGRKIFERALAKLEAIKDENPQYYEKYYWRVMEIYLENMFLQMEFYRNEYTPSYCRALIDEFERTLNKFGITKMQNSASMASSRISYFIDIWRSSLNG